MNRRRITFFTSLVVGFTLALSSAELGIAQSREGRIKAACLYHLTQFIEWPSSSRPDGHFAVCTYGEDTSFPFLESTLRGKDKDGKDYLIRSVDSTTDFLTCNLVFWGSASPPLDLPTLTKNFPELLTVSGVCDEERKADVRLGKHENKLQIVVKQKRIMQRAFSVSSELLQIASVED